MELGHQRFRGRARRRFRYHELANCRNRLPSGMFDSHSMVIGFEFKWETWRTLESPGCLPASNRTATSSRNTGCGRFIEARSTKGTV